MIFRHFQRPTSQNLVKIFCCKLSRRDVGYFLQFLGPSGDHTSGQIAFFILDAYKLGVYVCPKQGRLTRWATTPITETFTSQFYFTLSMYVIKFSLVSFLLHGQTIFSYNGYFALIIHRIHVQYYVLHMCLCIPQTLQIHTIKGISRTNDLGRGGPVSTKSSFMARSLGPA